MSNAAVGLCVIGASGRMGQRVLARVGPDFEVRTLLEVPGAKAAASDGVVQTSEPSQALSRAAGVQAAIDFTAPAVCSQMLPVCAAQGIAYVLASTALSDADEAAIAAAAERIPVVVASNFSVGVNLMLDLVERATRRAGEAFDVEIVELHHRYKRDAPSGTALALADAASRGRNGALQPLVGRAGESPRQKNEIGISAARGGDVSGEHTLFLFGDGERLELTHRAGNRDIFADGALRAARWAVGRAPGRYDMRDVLA